MNASGNTTRSAPPPAHSAVNRSTFASVASTSKATGAACTTAAFTLPPEIITVPPGCVDAVGSKLTSLPQHSRLGTNAGPGHLLRR
jgi:hypothetical protein